MKPGEWYKEFGGRGKTAYYHLLKVQDDKVYVEEYVYHPVLQRVLATDQRAMSSKAWMEREVQNYVHTVPKEQVPFLISV